MINHLTPKAEAVLNLSLEVARDMGHTYIGSEHLLVALCEVEDSIAGKILESRSVRADALRAAIIDATGVGTRSSLSPADMTPRVRKIIEGAAVEAMKAGQSRIGSEHLLLSLLNERSSVAVHFLEGIQIPIGELKADIQSFLSLSGKAQSAALSLTDGKLPDTKKSKTPTLHSYGKDLTDLAEKGKLDPMIGREEEVERLIQILSRRSKNNPCLIGEPGVGKTAVVEGLANMIATGQVPVHLKAKRIISLDLAGMLAGAKYRGEFEERFKNILTEIGQNPDNILFIDEIHTIVGAGAAEGAIDAANIIKPALARGEMQVIGATTVSEYRRYIEKDAALERRFQPIMVQQPTKAESVLILMGLRDKYEAHHRIKISDEAIRSAVELSVRCLPDRFLPDKALDLLDEAASRLRIVAEQKPEEWLLLEQKMKAVCEQKEQAIIAQDFEQAASLRDDYQNFEDQLEQMKKDVQRGERNAPKTLQAADIADVVTQWTGIPVSELMSEEGEKLLSLEEQLSRRVVGQEEAIRTLSEAIRRSRTGLKDPNRPIGSFLFLGSSGVGKTELSLALSEALFGTENALIRLDMSEYMEKHSVSRMIGSPPGYVGFEEGGQLTEKVRRRPYSVVLFDEIEKAHPDIYNLLLQILEDGTLTDSQGRRVDFRNTVLILTSNVGSSSDSKTRALGFSSVSDAQAKQAIEQERRQIELRQTFRPEFLNRMDAILTFSPLGKQELYGIAQRLLDKCRVRLSDMQITLSYNSGVVEQITKVATDSALGARPLRREVTQQIENLLATEMLKGRLQAGDRVELVYEDDQYRCRINKQKKSLE
ncbi:MAG: ATP-dependent Clp protease ATP-binding subunit [Clostridia bacterium]|nr:ATP-dependent Clp protease ATP-binding subunit [Clostridia bacterium]